MTADQLRNTFLEFYSTRGHAVIPSSPLVPENDPTTLFTGSGMQPMVPYLLGEKHQLGTRIVDSQKCFRSQDIEDVGDNRHTTFFEMLGNWSLGDYFKHEQLSWVWELFTKELGIDPQRLYVTVFRGNDQIGIGKDEESVKIWQELFAKAGIEVKAVDHAEEHGMQGGRIFYYADDKNWWSRVGAPKNMPVGEPGGPDSEMFYDYGADLKLHENSQFADQPCHVNCDCGRFMEIGNSVFMEYIRTEAGFEPLPEKNVDFGGGFERILAVINHEQDVFNIDLFSDLKKFIEQKSGHQYGQDEATTHAFRVILDHVRAATMLASDGVYPSNKAQGYYSRRLLRRAIRYAGMIDIRQPFLADAAAIVAQVYLSAYPNVQDNLSNIQSEFVTEENKFQKALEKGIKEIEKIDQLDAQVAFHLYETYGFPFELTAEIAEERGEKISEADFQDLKQQHAQESRTASAGMFKGGLQDQSEQTTRYHTATHLLHAALRKILGESVQQKGSNITADRLRFDFSFERSLTDQEKQQVEDQINDWIDQDLPMTKQIMPKTEAITKGAIAFFIEKYPDEVSVYTIGQDPETDWISKELCGGPHVSSTGEIGHVKITKEQSASAGVRRIYIE